MQDMLSNATPAPNKTTFPKKINCQICGNLQRNFVSSLNALRNYEKGKEKNMSDDDLVGCLFGVGCELFFELCCCFCSEAMKEEKKDYGTTGTNVTAPLWDKR